MTFGDDLDDLVDEAREAAEDRMVDECVIRRKTGRTTDANGKVTPTYRQLYAGPCFVQIREVDPTRPEAGVAIATVLRLRVDVPTDDTVGVKTDDEVLLTGVSFDDDLVGKVFRVTSGFHGSAKSARRLPVEETAT